MGACDGWGNLSRLMGEANLVNVLVGLRMFLHVLEISSKGL